MMLHINDPHCFRSLGPLSVILVSEAPDCPKVSQQRPLVAPVPSVCDSYIAGPDTVLSQLDTLPASTPTASLLPSGCSLKEADVLFSIYQHSSRGDPVLRLHPWNDRTSLDLETISQADPTTSQALGSSPRHLRAVGIS